MKRLLVALVVLLLLLVGADRLAAARAGSMAADRAKSAFSLSDADADVHGFPFITQVLGNRMKHVTITTAKLTRKETTFNDVTVDAYGVNLRRSGLTDVSLGDHADRATVHVNRLTASGEVLQDVQASGNDIGIGSDLTLNHVSGNGVVPAATIADEVKKRVGMDVTVAKKGDDLGVTGSVLGQPLAAVATPSVVKGGLRIALGQVTLGGNPVSADAVKRLTGMTDLAMTVPVDLSSLPGLKLSGVKATDSGLSLQLAGDRLTLAR